MKSALKNLWLWIIAAVMTLLTAAGADAAKLAGYWEFSDPLALGKGEDLVKGKKSPNLVIVGTSPASSSTLSDGTKTLSGVITTVAGNKNYLKLAHGIPPNGGSATMVNQYSLMYDIFSPVSSRSKWRCLLQTETTNTTDGDYFINNAASAKLGTQALGYTTSTFDDKQWKRVVITVDLGKSFKVYVDGALFHTHASQPVDGRYALGAEFLLFADDNSESSPENHPVHCGAVAMWDGALTAAEVAALGKAGVPVPMINHAPEIAQGADTTMMAFKDGSAVTTILRGSDPEEDEIAWTLSREPLHGSVTVDSNNTTCPVSYTSAPGYVGTDSFVVTASDGELSKSITVYVTVQEKATKPQLVGLWTFDDADNRNKATVGFELEPFGAGLSVVPGMSGGDGAMRANPGSYYLVTHGAPPNGKPDANRVNRYSIMWDVKIPAASAKIFKCLLQTNPSNSDDGDLFINDTNKIGTAVGVGGYSSSALTPEVWYRVVLTINNGVSRNIYVNGQRVYSGTVVGSVDEMRYGLGAQILALADDDGEDGTIDISALAMWNDSLNDEQVALLGGPGVTFDAVLPEKPEQPGGLWQFDEPTRPDAGIFGERLIRQGSGFTFVPGMKPGDGAIEIAPGSRYLVKHGIPANGGGTKVNEYTILWDVKYPSAGTEKAFYQTNLANTDGAELLADAAGKLGNLALGGFSAQATLPNTWYRVMMVVKNGVKRSIYVNGALWYEGNAGTVDDDYALDLEGFLAFSDGNGRDGTIVVSNLAVWGRAFSFGEVIRMSGTGTPVADGIIPLEPNRAPVISEGETYTLNVAKDGEPKQATIHATDPDGDLLEWLVSVQPSHGTVTINGNDGTCVVTYTPEPGFAGLDTFAVQVSDGNSSTTMTFNVAVVDPTADPVLTIVSPYGTATPPPGRYSYARGTALTNSVEDEGDERTRRHCIGWTMVGDGPYEGTVGTMNMTLTRDSTLTWLWQTEHHVEVATDGGGTASVSTGWYQAGRPLQVTAAPTQGYHFAGWSGDIEGCTVGGKSIMLPMDRPYSTITAKFMKNENFTVVGLPDTQNYCRITNVTDLFTQQTRWVLENKQNLNIKFLTHFGDIVDAATSASQWKRATDAMDLLDSKLPYGVCPGNHDLANGSNDYINRFGPAHPRWVDPASGKAYDWYQGGSPRGYSSYQVLHINGRDFMFLHLDCDAPNAELAWAATVLSQHPRTLTMLTTHDYLAETGAYSASGSGNGQRGRINYPAPYISVGPDRNTVTKIWDTLVKPFNQVYMVVCGHNFAQYNVQSLNNAGKVVHEVLADYQTLPNGGNAFLRIMEFRPSSNEIYNTTYSPYLGRYMSNSRSPSDQLRDDNTGMLDLTDKDGGEFSITTDFDTRFNSTLTVISAQPSVSPAVGTASIEDGTPVVATAEDYISGQTRYKCTGWSLSGSQSASGTGNTAAFTMNGNATLMWSWSKQYQLSTQTVGRGIISVNTGWQAEGAQVNIVAQPDPGFAFIGWSGDIEGCEVDGEAIVVPMTRGRGPVIARFTSLVPTHNVEIVSPYPSVVPAPASYSYEEGTEVTFSAHDLIDGTARRVCVGWTASGAIEESGTGGEVTLAVNGDFTLTWHWKTQYLLKMAVNGPGSIEGEIERWVDEDGTVSVTAVSDTGANFTNWSGDTELGMADGDNFIIARMTRAVDALTANFTLGNHILIVESSEGTTIPAPGTYSLPYGTVVKFSALPSENGRRREFPAAWEITPEEGETIRETSLEGSVTITGDTTLAWEWEPEVLLEVVSGGEGIVVPTNTAGWRKVGDVVTLSALPREDFTFFRWTGDVPGKPTTQSVSFTMDQPRTVAADFTAVKAPGGTPKWWLERHTKVESGDLAAAEQSDVDHDGQTAAEEFIAGMTDRDGGQFFSIKGHEVVEGSSGPELMLGWPGAQHRLYSLWAASAPSGPFTLVAENIPVTEPYTTFSVLLSENLQQNFFKVSVSLIPGGELYSDPPAMSPEPKEGSVIRDMCYVPAGFFTMGDDQNGEQSAMPTHRVYTSAFFMDKFEVTLGEWKEVATWAADHGYDLPVELVYDPAPDHPAPGVSWFNAVKWCNARSEMEGRVPAYYTDEAATVVYRTGDLELTSAHVNWAGNGYRLPTEAEWEKAARGGLEGKLYGWGDEPQVNRANGWLYQVAIDHTEAPYPLSTPVGHFNGSQEIGGPDAANAYGIYDMNGNVWEWVWDRYAPYDGATQFDPKGPDTGDVRITRGGSWWNNEFDLTNAHRYPFPAVGEDVYGMISFRCMRSAGPNEASAR